MRKLIIAPFIAVMFSATMLGGCSRNMDSKVHTSGAAVGKVLEGTVVAASPITIKENDNLQDNGLGMLSGGVVGGLAGSGIGGGTGKSLAVAGAAIAGAAIGAAIQDKLGTNVGMQYVVRLDPKYVNNSPEYTERHNVSVNRSSIDDDIKGSIDIANTKTDLISIIQGKDVLLQPGQRVLIVYNNDRPRLMAAGPVAIN